MAERNSLEEVNDKGTLINEEFGRNSRNSTGCKEEFVGPRLSVHEIKPSIPGTKKDGRLLAAIFLSMVVVGLGNRVFNKLMTIPMYNYPNFLNILTTFVYIPVCFAYIIPMTRRGFIPQYQTEMPKRPFAVMGGLDALASIMQIFGATYLPGPLVILLLQAAIPTSMIISYHLLHVKYSAFQYLGAFIVAAGIVTVLAPTLTGSGGSIVWSLVLILSAVPMTLSSVYKEIALGEKEIDPMFLNGWVAIFQFGFALILCLPSSLASDPPVHLPDLPKNFLDGLYCYVGRNSITCADGDGNCTPDDCANSPLFVNIYLVFNQLYNLLIILILKYGSANLLYLALTIMVPLGNVAFTLPFVPSNAPLRGTDIIGLVIICIGLGCYRFAGDLYVTWKESRQEADGRGNYAYFGDDNKYRLERMQVALINEEESKVEFS